jgi:ring-1,2-phenylacetyl-CoA epoxidase subunit PaaD
MNIIEQDINAKLIEKGIDNFTVETVLTPAWTTEWMSKEGKSKLKEYGIAPPSIGADGSGRPDECPNCGSKDTQLKSEFGSTACKALYVCESCKEPFDYFKCH